MVRTDVLACRCKIDAEESAIDCHAVSLLAAPQQALRGGPSFPDEAVRAALKLVVTSRQFGKSRRCAALLTYLIESALERAATPPQELEIGIAVFGRDPHSYFPGDDPIVRVQACRLRQRLAAYYAQEGASAPLRISIPLGSYRACIAAAEPLPAAPSSVVAPALVFRPLVCQSSESQLGCFIAGLNDELAFRLHRSLPAASLGLDIAGGGAGRQGATRVLEGSLRQDGARRRVSLYLRHGTEGTVLWCQQFDSATETSIAGQEQLAERCVQSLLRYLQA